MRAISFSLGLAVALAAAALVHAAPGSEAGKESGSGSPGQSFSGGKQCVVAAYVRAESADADDRLILHIGTRAHVSHLPAYCPGLMRINNNGRVDLVPTNGRYCAGDSFTVSGGLVSMVVGLDQGTSRCTLGPFEQVPEKTLSQEYRR